MAKAYSEDLRERVIAAVDAGATRRAAAVQFKVSISSAIRWVRRWQADWEIAAKPRGGSVSPLEDYAAALVALVPESPDLTLDEFCALLRERNIETSRVSVWRFFSRHGLSFKKILHASEQERADVAAARQRWREDQPSLEAARLVFIDETGTTTNMARTRGRAMRGKRLIGRVPHGHWKVTTFVAGLRCRRGDRAVCFAMPATLQIDRNL